MKKHSKKNANIPAKSVISKDLEREKRNVAGMDIGANSIFVCAGPSNDELSVFEVPTFTADLKKLVRKLKEFKVESVAMEATGIYWITIYDMLEASKIEACLINPRDIKAIPGKKTDVLDCQRIQQYHSYGLLKNSFRPGKDIVILRTYVRQRSRLIESAAMQMNHMHKSLVQMNIQIGQVVSDISGATGMRIIKSVIGGNHDPIALAKLRDYRCKSSEEDIAKSLEGYYKPENILALKQSVEIYDLLQEKIIECEVAIKQLLDILISADNNQLDAAKTNDGISDDLPNHKRISKSSYHFNAAEVVKKYAGVDLTTLTGISENTTLKIISEIGIDMSRWASVKHFVSWLGLCPNNDVSGGKVLSSKTKKTKNKAAQALRLAASTLYNTKTALGAFYRRVASRLGKCKAIAATAHKLAIYIYHMLRDKKSYSDVGGLVYEQQYEKRVLMNISRRATELGYDLVKRDKQPDPVIA
jgi:transposase